MVWYEIDEELNTSFLMRSASESMYSIICAVTLPSLY